MSGRSTAICFCRSRPLRPGREMSSTRQLGTKVRGWARNSGADAKVCGSQPSQRINNSSDSRTDTSSSTTNTIGTACYIPDSPNVWPNACAPITLYLQPETARRVAPAGGRQRTCEAGHHLPQELRGAAEGSVLTDAPGATTHSRMTNGSVSKPAVSHSRMTNGSVEKGGGRPMAASRFQHKVQRAPARSVLRRSACRLPFRR
jgi:hypothetical protein